jgi:hypothetical protein
MVPAWLADFILIRASHSGVYPADLQKQHIE